MEEKKMYLLIFFRDNNFNLPTYEDDYLYEEECDGIEEIGEGIEENIIELIDGLKCLEDESEFVEIYEYTFTENQLDSFIEEGIKYEPGLYFENPLQQVKSLEEIKKDKVLVAYSIRRFCQDMKYIGQATKKDEQIVISVNIKSLDFNRNVLEDVYKVKFIEEFKKNNTENTQININIENIYIAEKELETLFQVIHDISPDLANCVLKEYIKTTKQIMEVEGKEFRETIEKLQKERFRIKK